MSKLTKFVLFAIMMIFLIQNVFALGITPAKSSINFEPSLEKTEELTIINSEGKNLDLIIYAREELNESISISETRVLMSPEQETKKITYKISLPETLSPGLHKAEIVVLQSPSSTTGRGASLGASLAVVKQIHVYVPYPGKYLEAELNVFGTGTDKRFVISMVGRGQTRVESASAEIGIYDAEGRRVKTLKTNAVAVGESERKEVIVEWKADVKPGKYIARAILDYDGEKILLEKSFEVGELVVDLQQIFVKDFKLGEIAKFNMVVQNKWNEMIKNVYSEMRIFDKNMNEIDSIMSASYDIPAGMQTTMNYYWDTKNISEGLYNANVILYYSDKKTQQDLKLDVTKNKIDVIGLGYVISEAQTGGTSIVSILIMVIVLLVIINIIWFVVLRKVLKNRKS